MSQVVLKKVTKVYPGNIRAVDAIDLSICDGEFIVLVGPSGCGKSTTLRMVAGLEEITDGQIIIGDKVVNGLPAKQRDIAMVFQNYALYPHMTVYKNMAFALKLRKFPRKEIDQRVRDAATILGIEKLLDRKPKALSGGQRQRVAVGRAIVRKPKAFLFDEPLSNLDAKLRVEMRAELKRLHHSLATTTIYVTHDQEEAMTLGERIVVMKDGVIQQCASPLEVYREPVNRFVAGFVGTPPMNFFAGKLAINSGAMVFTDGDMSLDMTDSAAAKLQKSAAADVIFGIRPEAMSFSPASHCEVSQNSFAAQVRIVEPLGEKMDVFLTTASQKQIVARVDADSGVSPGENITVYADMDKAHIFAADEAGLNLSL